MGVWIAELSWWLLSMVIDFNEKQDSWSKDGLVQVYNQSCVIRWIYFRAFCSRRFRWLTPSFIMELDFLQYRPAGSRFHSVAGKNDDALAVYGGSCPVLVQVGPIKGNWVLYIPEAFAILPYEQALTRQDSLTGDGFDCSAQHAVNWRRTRSARWADVEFLVFGVSKTLIGCKKAAPSMDPEDLCVCWMY